MNLYLVTQTKNNNYDSYDSFVVAAKDSESARLTHPSGREWDGKSHNGEWCASEYVEVELIGKAKAGYKNQEIICSSFNAG
jgi:hypothetical protein